MAIQWLFQPATVHHAKVGALSQQRRVAKDMAKTGSSFCLVKQRLFLQNPWLRSLVVLSCFVETQFPLSTNWVAMPKAEWRAKKLPTTKEHTPKHLKSNICFLCNALQKAWHCLPSKSVPSNPGRKKTNTRQPLVSAVSWFLWIFIPCSCKVRENYCIISSHSTYLEYF